MFGIYRRRCGGMFPKGFIQICCQSYRKVAALDKIFSENYNRREIFDYFLRNIDSMQEHDVIHFLYMCSKNRLVLQSQHFKLMSRKLSEDRVHLLGPQLGKALYSLHIYSCRSVRELQLVSVLERHLNNCMDVLSAQSACNMIYGLQKMSTSAPVVLRLVDTLSVKIARCPDSFSGAEVAIALYGLHNMDSSHDEVRNLLFLLAQKIEQSHSLNVSGQVLSNCLYGLRGMRSDCPEVLYLLRVIGTHAARQQRQQIEQPKQSAVDTSSRVSGRLLLNNQGVSNALYGLRGMSSDHAAVRDMLAVLAVRIPAAAPSGGGKHSGVKMGAEAAATALYGMQRLSSSHREVRALLATLTPLLASSRGGLSGRFVGMALKGFSCMSDSDGPEVAGALQALSEVLQRGDLQGASMDVQGVVMAMSGLQNMSSACPTVRAVLRSLAPMVEKCFRDEASFRHFQALAGAKTLIGFSGGLSLHHEEVRALVRSLLPALQKCSEPYWPQSIALALSGLRCCQRAQRDASAADTDAEDISRKLLSVLLEKSRGMEREARLNLNEFCLAVSGLESLGEAGTTDGEVWKDVEGLLADLCGKFEAVDDANGEVSREQLLLQTSRCLARALSGLRRMSLLSVEVGCVLQVLQMHLKGIRQRDNRHFLDIVLNTTDVSTERGIVIRQYIKSTLSCVLELLRNTSGSIASGLGRVSAGPRKLSMGELQRLDKGTAFIAELNGSDVYDDELLRRVRDSTNDMIYAAKRLA